MLEAYWFRIICLAFIGTSTLNAAEFDVESLQNKMLTTIEAVKPAVVAIRGRDGGAFSGVIVSKDGHVLSAGHAVRPGGRYQVLLPDGRRLRGRGKGSNPQADCALLQITGDFEDLPFVRMGDSRSLVRNQPCLSLSFPGGQGSRGVPVVRFGRIVRSGRGRGMLQSTALMEPGDSGGPLFDLEGRVIGIHSRIGQSMSRNYEVPVNTFKRFWNELNREESFTQSGPAVPRLGFRGMPRRDGSGIDIRQIVDGSLADKHGIEPGDVIEAIDGRDTPSIEILREVLITARDDDSETVVVEVLRDEEDVELTIPFDVKREAAPDVPLPDYENKAFPEPKPINQLANLPREFAGLESELDDACVEISSKLSDGEELSIVGTLIKATPFIVSKSSMVAENPLAKLDGFELNLEVIARDQENDLVLLKATKTNSDGINLGEFNGELPSIGSFLITPDANGEGLVSIVSTKTFRSRKQQSRGFLGVMPADYQDRGGAIL
ncbi:MAG: S1C family serine protease, partial [Planctomycetaceae bacterium]